jgi:hypothetical protein
MGLDDQRSASAAATHAGTGGHLWKPFHKHPGIVNSIGIFARWKRFQ